MLRTTQRALAVLLCAALVWLTPGQAAYAAAARAVETTPASVPALPALAVPAVPSIANLPGIDGPVAQPLEAAAPLTVTPAVAAGSAQAVASPSKAAVAVQPATLTGSQAPTQGALAKAVVQAAAPAATAEAARAAGSVLFDAAAKTAAAPQEAIDVELSAALAEAPALAAATGSSSIKRPTIARRLWAGTRAAVARHAPNVTLSLASALRALALAALAQHWSVVGGLLVPLAMGTCNSMQERAIKDATILPQQQVQAEIAKKELDAILVQFGKRLKEQAERDARVNRKVSAHTGEHGMEEPILEVLPKLKERWSQSEGPTKEEALAELKAEVLEHLGEEALKGVDPKVIEELLQKTGSWDELLEWEKRHGVLDALKEAAKGGGGGGQGGEKTIEKDRENTGGMSGAAGNVLSVLLLAGIGLVLHLAFGPGIAVAGVVMAGVVAADTKPPSAVPLDTYLLKLGLSKDEADFLKGFTIDLGARDIAPVVGRSKELRKVITILSKPAGTQNNPMILGDKGVGKTAVVEAVAKYLYYDKLPSLKGKRILELDTGRLMAGSGKVGEMEERLTKLRTILAKTDNKVILFVDEIHSILKNVTTASSVPDLLKSPLRNGEMTVIGATTVGEFRKYVEQDPAFADRFDTVNVNEPSQEEAIEMLEGDIEYLERKFDVEIDPEAAKAAVKLSARYIPEKFLPRKARVLLEASIAEAKPEAARDGVQVQIDQLTDRLRIFVKRYAAAKAANAGTDDAFKKAEEVQLHNKIVSLYTTILSLDEKRDSFVKEKIGKEHIARTLARETGIALGDLGEDEYQRLLKMEPWFKERIVGQDEAVKAIADTVRTNKSGLSDPNRPQGVFLFAGKTGTGKTALARTLAEFLFSNPDAVIRLDMSEYMEKFAVQRLFGAPPGYVGYDSGGELTEKVRRNPYSVILLDEIEKAHPDVLNALLQIFDAGRMTDGRQNTVNFKNTIIIMTSNMGAAAEGDGDAFKQAVIDAIKRRLSKEFYNRIDKVVVFNPLRLEQAKDILEIMLKDLQKRLREQDLELKVSDEAKDFLAKKGFDPDLGARPLKRVVESDITNAVSSYLLEQKAEGNLVNGGVLSVVLKDGIPAFELTPNPPPVLEPAPLPSGPLGAKLRRILDEAAKGSDSTKDMQTFESLLFPDRKEVVLGTPLGAFQPNAAGKAAPSEKGGLSYVRELGQEAPGLKDAKLSELENDLSSALAGRWPAGAAEEAAVAWLDAFARLGKELSPEKPLRVFGSAPAAKSGELALDFDVRANVTYAQQQRLARLFRDHFTSPLPDEDAVRARAAQLKDEGLDFDRDLLDLKRLVESVPGATFGYQIKQDGTLGFWLRLPVNEAPKPAPVEKPKDAAASSDAKAPAPAPATAPGPAKSADNPISATDARLSPSKMFLFLTQRGPEELATRRMLVADLLDSKSTQVRLVGLHLAASMLDAPALREVASAGRMLRLSDQKDYALFSALADRVPGLPMTAQRQALLDAYQGDLDGFIDSALTGSYGAQGYAEARFYSELAAAVQADPAPEAESNERFARLERIRLRYWRIVKRFFLWGVPGEALGLVALHYMGAPLGLMIAAPIAASLILLWICQGNFGSYRGNARSNARFFESLIFSRLTDFQRKVVAQRRLEEAAARDRSPGETPAEVELLRAELPQLREAWKNPLFERWTNRFEKELAKQKKKGTIDRDEFNTLGLLAALQSFAPEKTRGRIAQVVVEPLRRRWLPSNMIDYLNGLGLWASEAKLSSSELEDLFGLVVNFPSNRSAGLAQFMPVYTGLSKRKDLTPDLKASFEQFLAGLSAEGSANNTLDFGAAVELARARARVGYPRQAWAGLREAMSGRNYRPNNWGGQVPFQSLDRFIKEAPPEGADREWIVGELRWAETVGGQAQLVAQAALPLSRLIPDQEERLAMLLKALREISVAVGPQYELYKDLLEALEAAGAAPLADAETQFRLTQAVRENTARLSSSAQY